MILFLLAFTLGQAPIPDNFVRCGIEKQAMKTLVDVDARSINYTVTATTIAVLNKLKAPPTTRTHRTPAELQVWSVRGTLELVRSEADGDFHVVLKDGGATLIVEIPRAGCVTNPKLLATIAGNRSAIQSIPLHSMVEVSGPAFFDFPHHQTGHALNYIELHPVLSINRQ
jgi:hypothetical protein